MKILALDLSTTRGSLALTEGGSVLAQQEWPNDRRSTAPFFSALQAAITVHGKAALIVIGLGPGSYSGTRIAIAAGIGLAKGSGASLAGLPSVLAVSHEPCFAVIGDAKRASFFFARVESPELSCATGLFGPKELASRLAEATLPIYTSDELPQFPQVPRRFPSALRLAELACRFPQKLVRAPLTPIYLREPHITMPRAGK